MARGHGRGRLCNTDLECKANAAAASTHEHCPTHMSDTWWRLPGFSRGNTAAMGCRDDGSWLAPGVQRFRPMHYGLNRSAAFHLTRAQCMDFVWTAPNGRKRRNANEHDAGPAMLGTDRDIARKLHQMPALQATILRMSMGRPWDLTKPSRPPPSDPMYSPCVNLAFVVCAVRGWLRAQGGPRFFLASRSSDIGNSCKPCGTCRDDLAWDECWCVPPLTASWGLTP